MGEKKRREQAGTPAPRKANSRKPLAIGVTVLVLAAIVLGVVFLTAAPKPTSDELPVAAPNAAAFPAQLDQYGVSVGAEDAPVVVREFADYQCPACGAFSEASKRLKQEYVEAGKVRFVYFDLPLRQHQNAFPAAQAARCAGDQGAYWEMHERLYDSQTEWSGSNDPVATFARYGEDLGLEERRLRRCMTTELHREAVEASRRVAMQLQVTSTPTVLVDNIRLTRPGWGQLSALVERELSSASK
ncbi:MAG: DsbA family protein [Marinobacter sp.]|uniref:DsbA family protein n=1 Tax=Marinobacter sp. TaxID=50741 RepID=UPI001B69C810|nr:thioredoxin domain-containing protein [Marinobacter sp.]MBQ0746093.1 DsbA family protein [Marinobacter sp.]MBQ0815477.1 DsbA family protein [Marinobacter sp.]|tara:strand:- start:150 stop:881 length:732 start_codon:yes stop_codon:yes gene_type:complete